MEFDHVRILLKLYEIILNKLELVVNIRETITDRERLIQ